MMPAMFTCGRTAGWCAHILEQKRLGKLVRPAAIYTGPAPRAPRVRRGLGRDREGLASWRAGGDVRVGGTSYADLAGRIPDGASTTGTENGILRSLVGTPRAR